MSNLRSRRGEGCSLDRVQKVYAAGSIQGARPLLRSNRALDLSRSKSGKDSAQRKVRAKQTEIMCPQQKWRAHVGQTGR